jgi:hypothetical protein
MEIAKRQGRGGPKPFKGDTLFQETPSVEGYVERITKNKFFYKTWKEYYGDAPLDPNWIANRLVERTRVYMSQGIPEPIAAQRSYDELARGEFDAGEADEGDGAAANDGILDDLNVDDEVMKGVGPLGAAFSWLSPKEKKDKPSRAERYRANQG